MHVARTAKIPAQVIRAYEAKYSRDVDIASTASLLSAYQPPPDLEPLELIAFANWLGDKPDSVKPDVGRLGRVNMLEFPCFTLILKLSNADSSAGRLLAHQLTVLTTESALLEPQATGAGIIYADCLALRQVFAVLLQSKHRSQIVNSGAIPFLDSVAELVTRLDLTAICDAKHKRAQTLEILRRERVLGGRVKRSAENRIAWTAVPTFEDAPKIDPVAERARYARQQAVNVQAGISGPKVARIDIDDQLVIERAYGSVQRIKVRPAIVGRRDDMRRQLIERNSRTIVLTPSSADKVARPTKFLSQALYDRFKSIDDRYVFAWCVLLIQVPLPQKRYEQLIQSDDIGTVPDEVPALSGNTLSFRVLGLPANAESNLLRIQLPPTLAQLLNSSLDKHKSKYWIRRAAKANSTTIPTLRSLQAAIFIWHALLPIGLDSMYLELVTGAVNTTSEVWITYRQIAWSDFQIWFSASMAVLLNGLLAVPSDDESYRLVLQSYFDVPRNSEVGFLGSPIKLSDKEIEAARKVLKLDLRRTRLDAMKPSRTSRDVLNRLNSLINILRFEVLLASGIRPISTKSRVGLVRIGSKVFLYVFDKETYTSAAPRLVPLSPSIFDLIENSLIDINLGIATLCELGTQHSEAVARFIEDLRRFIKTPNCAWYVALPLSGFTIHDSCIEFGEPCRSGWKDCLSSQGMLTESWPDNATRHRFATRLSGLVPDQEVENALGHVIHPGIADRFSAARITCLLPFPDDLDVSRPPGLWRRYG